MGTFGGLVVPLVIAAVIGFVVGWFFALAGRGSSGATAADGPDGPPSAADATTDATTDVATLEERAAQMESDYAQRSRVFAQREAELTAAGRKVVEQLRQQERELAELRGGAVQDETSTASLPVGEPGPSETAETPATGAPAGEPGPSETAETPAADALAGEPGPSETAETPAADAVAGEPGPSETAETQAAAAPVAATLERSRRRAVIDPATGQPIGSPQGGPVSSGAGDVEDPAPRGEAVRAQAGEHEPQAIDDAGSLASDSLAPPPVEPSVSPEAELSVRLIAPEEPRDDLPVIDLRERRQVREARQADRHRAPGVAVGGGIGDGELTDVVGIGPKTARLLREAGIVSLGDLAALDPEGPAVDSRESLRSRMLREDWVGQARALTR